MRKPWMIVALALALCAIASQAYAWEWAFWKKITRGNTKGDVVVGVSGDTLAVPFGVMPDGTQYVTEKYPAEYQASTQSLISTTVAANTSTATTPGTPYPSSSIYGLKWLNVTVASGAAAAPWRVKLLGSDDAQTWVQLLNPNQSGAAWVDTDTLMFRGHGNTPTGGISFPISTRAGYMIPHKFLGAIFSSDSSAGATMTVTVSVSGRQQ